MTNELTEILTTIRRPFQQEIRSGCQDNVVINGLNNYVQLWVKKARQLTRNLAEKRSLSELADLFVDYEALSPMERMNVIQAATKLIDAMTSGMQKTSPPVGNLPLFQSVNQQTREAAVQHDDKTDDTRNTQDAIHPTQSPLQEEITVSDTPVSLDPASLNFLTTPLQYASGIGPRRTAKLTIELDIRTVGDLLEYYPRDYLDRGHFRSIYDVGRSGAYETIQGKVVNQNQFTPRRPGAKPVGKIAIYDETGVAQLVTFGRRVGYLKHLLKVGTQVVVSGKFARRNNEIQTTDFEFEILEEEDADLIHTGRIVPKYPLTAKLTQRNLRQWVKAVLDEYHEQYPELLPLAIRQRHQLIDRPSAIGEIHFPRSETHLEAARKRLAFDEFFLLELGLELKKQRWKREEKGLAFQVEGELLNRFIAALPFQLTNAQKRVFEEIKVDMANVQAMNRLLQGDVGSGKTIVAAMSLLCAIQSGYQGALMVPTEILAEQHTYNLSELLEPLNLNVVLLKSDLPKKEREEALASIADGSAHLVVGTHALIQEGVDFHQLGLVIIDEQHRFGVMQRATLRDKGNTPDVLVMTATPIPRTLALTVYGDLNVCVIDEMPPGRRKVTTKWVKEDDREKLYTQIEKEIQRGRQAYIVYPLVEESEKLEEIKAATEMAEHFQRDVFPHLRVGLLHGRMRSVEKQGVMSQLKDREIDILVATTVIEVGIDVPNVSIMVIENAERFGLAQLHQLRGRVGRGRHKSACYLIANPKNDDSVHRIKVMTRTNDGFELAEADLEIRGPGEFFGTRQAGLPDFKIANIIKDAALLELAKSEANRLAQADSSLSLPEHQVLKKMLQTQWKEHLEMASIG
ncbi:MAG: ATP-dependent DNA helicase RecG [Candidatus Poribacteria bacterium]|nr:ATP-dependent DNA helicase RecG [Candidatus Poribacteria bacterium]